MIYLLSSIIAFSGLLFGIATAFIAKDELKAGREYFIALQNLIIALIVGVLAYFSGIELYFVAILTLIAFFILYLIGTEKKSYAIYPLLAVVFYIGSGIRTFFIAESALIFLYGFPTAGLLIKKKKDILFVTSNHISFVIIANLLPLVFL